MFKPVASILLAFFLALLVREAVVSLQGADIPPALPAVEKKKDVPMRNTVKDVAFYPSVPSPLPDLNQGYLFNEERFLQGEVEAVAEEEAESGTELSVDIDTVEYAGSIIIGDMRKGLISYAAKQAPVAAKIKVRSRSPVRIKSRKYAQLLAGDSLSGYKVVSVEPDKMVFVKGTETIEKMLHDPEKVRLAPPPVAKKIQRQKVKARVSKAKRVALDKARSTTRKVQSTRKVTSKKSAVPREKIQVPGVPVGR